MYDPYGFPIRVPGKLLEELGAHTGKFWSSLDLEPIVCDMIREFIKPAAAPALQAPPASQPQAASSAPAAPLDAGYQWKEVFLPSGTKLRAGFDRKPYFAVVEGAEIKYGEHPVSPSCFANLHGSGNRNAWKAIWLLLPGSDGWLPADVIRSARKAAIARLLGDDAPLAGQPARPGSAPEPAPRRDW